MSFRAKESESATKKSDHPWHDESVRIATKTARLSWLSERRSKLEHFLAISSKKTLRSFELFR